MEQNTPFSQIVSNCSKTNKDSAKVFLTIASENLYDISLLDHIAQLQSSIKDYESSIDTLIKMLSGANEISSVHAIRSNLATTYNKLNDPKSAISQLDQIPKDISTMMERSLSHYFLGDYDASENIMREIASIPNLPEHISDRIQYNLAIYDIEKGDFKRGYYQYIEKGHRINIWPTQNRAMIPQWRGEVESGKTIIIHAEGGIGDEIIGVRFMRKIQELGMRPVWKTNNKGLHEVFNRNGYECVLDFNEIDTFNAAQVMAMYLPVYLNLDKEDVWFGDYLKPCEEHVKKWSCLLPDERKLAVRWAGNMHYDQDLHRSIPMHHLEQLSYNGTKVSVQLGENVDWGFNPDINTIEDTLAILSLCDGGLVTSCTSVAHMAGALGVKTIVCPPIAYYYVWAKGSKWYGDHVEVIRQENWKDWDSVFVRVQERIDGKQL
jgi:uncharacterized protein YutE (UPF0331/DUF86 family)